MKHKVECEFDFTPMQERELKRQIDELNRDEVRACFEPTDFDDALKDMVMEAFIDKLNKDVLAQLPEE